MTGKIQPIKRSAELVPLSREHHDGLLLCWKINEGLAGNIATDRIGAYVLHFFDSHLAPHFESEEQFIFPLLSPDDGNRKEAELHHKVLRGIISNFRGAKQIPGLSLSYFADVLDRHIRFEERALFPAIEKGSSPEALHLAAMQLATHPENREEWKDQFWINKN